ncbi:MAG: hypothetical protein JST82_08105 [Bacteroidetes bacterium]|nr:hypothetical protein [Bacteroidota bacterium]
MATREYDCNNPTDQITIANRHKITQATFNSYLSAFWGAGAASVQPVEKSWDELDGMMSGADCTSMRWRLEMDENDTTNNDINLTVEPMLETVVNYSIAFFKGVRAAYNAETFHFYKGRHETGRYDVVFKAMSNTQEVVFYGDLSSDWP